MSRLYIGLVVLFSFAACVLLPTRVSALRLGGSLSSSNNLTISGNVYYGDGNQAAAHVMVQLQDTAGETRLQDETNDSGGFEFQRLGGGTYTLMVDVQGYQRVAASLNLSYMPEKSVVIRLRALSDEKETAAASSVSAHELSMPEKARERISAGKKNCTPKKMRKALWKIFDRPWQLRRDITRLATRWGWPTCR